MASTADQVALLLDVGACALPLAAALLLAFLPGAVDAARPRRALAAFLGMEAGIVLLGLVKRGLVGADADAMNRAIFDMTFVVSLLAGVFLALYPRPPRWRSPEGVATLAAVGFLAFACLAQVPLHALDADTFLRRVARIEGNALALLVLFALAMRRARAAGTPGAVWVANVPMLGIWGLAGGFNLYATLTSWGPLPWTRPSLNAIPWDTWHAMPVLWAGVWVGAFGAVVAWEARRRDVVPLLLIGLGAVASLASAASGVDNWPWVNGVIALAACAGVIRHGAFGVSSMPRAVQGALLATFTTFVFLLILSLALSVAPDSLVGLALAIFGGLFVAVGVAYFVLPDLRIVGFGAPAAPALEPIAPGARLQRRYRVEARLAEGGQGRVHLAHDTKLGRDVVLKSAGSEHAAREARTMAGLEHPNIARVYDVLEAADGPCIIIEYLPGGTLRARLAKGPLPLAEATRVLDGVLAALEAAHARGIVHGDVKPENVLFDERGAPKLADFGSARPVATGMTAQLAPSATLLYASPEQVRGQAPDPRSDLYAAGVLFHEMLTGQPVVPTEGMDDFALREAILRKPARLQLSGQPAAVERFVRRAVAKEPAKRFPDAAAMRAGLVEARWTAGGTEAGRIGPGR